MLTTTDVLAWSEARISQIHLDLERLTLTEIETAALRGAVIEQKKLLAALKNDAPPVWTDAA